MEYTPNQAFTMIELLVVIAIIAILAGLFCRPWPRRTASPANNSKQLMLAWRMYAGDNDDGLVSAKEVCEPVVAWAGPRWVFGWLDLPISGADDVLPEIAIKTILSGGQRQIHPNLACRPTQRPASGRVGLSPRD